jgi:hypothetical protein
MTINCEHCGSEFTGVDFNDVGFQYMMHPCDLGDDQD